MDKFNYENKKLETIKCNICGSEEFANICNQTVNGLKANTVICKVCGLIFINPRMTKSDYDEYYKSFYRHDRAEIKNRKFSSDLSKNFENARKFGKAIVNYMGQFVEDGLTIDVGSSTGGILYGMKESRNNLDLLGIEPSIEESQYAISNGVKTIRALFEDIDLDLDNKASNILCVQSLNHLLDPKKFLSWSYKTLKPRGHIFLAVKNWRHQVYRMGKLQSAVQIDHVYMFTPETLSILCKSAGFKIVYIDVDEGKATDEIKKQKADGLNTHHIRIVAKKDSIPSHMIFDKIVYLRTRLVLLAPLVKIIYLLKYSQSLAFFRKMTHIS